MKKMITKLCALLLIALLLTGLTMPVMAADGREVTVVLDGETIQFDVAPRITEGRTMVPVRAIFEALGATVAWDQTSRTVTSTAANGNVITMTIGNKSFFVNDVLTQMDAAPFVTGDRTLAPVRFVAQAMGLNVQWNPTTRTVLLTSGTLAKYDMFFPLANASEITVHDFELEGGYVTNWTGTQFPAPLAGLIATPNTSGPHPLVIIMHGAAMGSEDVQGDINMRVYAGFDYLVRQLAAEGYVVMSINVSIDYSLDYGESIWGEYAYELFEQHLDRLEQAVAGQNVGHGVNLTDMIDLDEIHIIGHSRGGENADAFVRRDREAGISRIRSLLRIAPVVMLYHLMEGDYGSHPDIPVAIILPEFDGDVQNQDGQLVFDEVMAEGENESILSLVYLRGANHNFFNRFTQVDDGMFHAPDVHRLTRAQQENFLMRYSAAWLALVSQGRTPWGTFNPAEPQPVSMFGLDVIASTYVSGLQSILAAPVAGVPAATATGSATAAFHEQWWNTDGFFNHPMVLNSSSERLPLYDLQWTGTDGAVSFSLLNGNLSAHQALSLYVAMDSSNELNPRGEDQAFTITLTDSAGATQSLLIPLGTSALTWHHGEFESFTTDEGEELAWRGFMPLGDLRIPLTYFKDINLSAVSSVTISFDQTASGAVMLSGMYLK